MVAREILIERTYRIGVQTVERENGPLCPDCGFAHPDTAHDRYFLTIQNRTYRSVIEVPVETARRYYRAMRQK